MTCRACGHFADDHDPLAGCTMCACPITGREWPRTRLTDRGWAVLATVTFIVALWIVGGVEL